MAVTIVPWFIGLGLLALGLHWLGVRQGWYGEHGFDHVTHFISGAGVWLGLWLALPTWGAWTAWLVGVAAWEAWEYWYGDPEDRWHNWRNMVHDTAFGLLGALLVYVVVV